MEEEARGLLLERLGLGQNLVVGKCLEIGLVEPRLGVLMIPELSFIG